MRASPALIATVLLLLAVRPGVALTLVQSNALYGMVAIEQRVSRGIQTLTMLSGPYASESQCEIFRSRYTDSRRKAGDRIVSSTCAAAAEPGSVFDVLLRGQPFPVVVFEDSNNLMAIANPQMQLNELVDVCGQIRTQLRRGTCHAPAAGTGK